MATKKSAPKKVPQKKQAKPLPPGNYTAKIKSVRRLGNQIHVQFTDTKPHKEEHPNNPLKPRPEFKMQGETTDTANPKDGIGRTKVPITLIPAVYQAEQSLAFLEGKLKYGEVNWRATPVYASVYLDAAARHQLKYAEGQDRDPLTRVHHLANASACFGIIIDAQHYGTLIDDRKMSNGNAILHIDQLQNNVQHLMALYKDKRPKHFKITEGQTHDGFNGSKGRDQY